MRIGDALLATAGSSSVRIALPQIINRHKVLGSLKVKRFLVFFLLVLLFPTTALAWWNNDWSGRKKITLNTTEAGAETKEALTQFPVPVRLHTGNFQFPDAKPDGKDIRFVAADDKTPLKFHIESFDAANELAIIWVQIPRLPGASNSEYFWMYYGNQKVAGGDDGKGTYDVNAIAAFHFSEKDGSPRDQTAYANHVGQSSAKFSEAGLIGPSVTFDGNSRLSIGASPSLKLVPAQGMTVSAWVKPTAPQGRAVLFAQTEGSRSVSVIIEGDSVYARVAGDKSKPVETGRGAKLVAGSWSHIVVTFKDRIVVYVNGVEASSVPAALVETGGEVVIGEGFAGDIDELQLSNIARSPDWIRGQFHAQGADGKLIGYGEGEAAEAGGDSSYLGILLSAVTLDGWIVIGILMVMMVVSFWVMWSKSFLIAGISKANTAFRERFSAATGDELMALAKVSGHENSSLFRVHEIGIRELLHRMELYEKKGMPKTLSPQALGAIRASIDAGLVRENERLNNHIVLLTIAISGGPFLGLLGTVVGVMITFAAIAAAGDVNVNSIAPGIAAALVATVAGLAVAIPALFGYNYLASRIKSVSNETIVFADEMVTRLAETYAN